MKKKIAAILGCMLIIIIVLPACGKDKNSNQVTTLQPETGKQFHVHTDKNGETYTHEAGEMQEDETINLEEKATDKDGNILISNQEAIELIKSYSAKKLSLKGRLKDYSFLVSTKKKEIKEKEYLEVVASVIIKNEKKDTVKINTKGTYYVSLDGKKCLKKNMKTGEVTEIK